MTNSRKQGLPLDGYSESIQKRHAKRKIGLVLFNGFPLLLAGTVVETLHLANVLGKETSNGGAPYEIHLLSASGGAVHSASSVLVQTTKCEAGTQSDCFYAVFVASGTSAVTASHCDRSIDSLQAIVEQAEMVFPVGDGRHMLYASSPPWLRRHMVRTMQESEWLHRLADALSPVEIALALVELDLGGEIARRIEQRIDLPSRRHFRAQEGKRAAAKLSEHIQTSARWLEANASRTITIDEAAQVALMSTRNFLRRFKLETGMTPSEYLLQVRIERCCRLLASTKLPVDKVARRCGIGNGGQLSKIFRRHMGSTPTEYRTKVQQPNVPVSITPP